MFIALTRRLMALNRSPGSVELSEALLGAMVLLQDVIQILQGADADIDDEVSYPSLALKWWNCRSLPGPY